ncbi:PleD family two-component system response regulator [Microvirga sp. 2MCAF38]|uniref:response regulator n=1 Tax=Microvirga sp. 2MCAF38 TaxID=3232989 RepID=UPI003F9E447A
MTGRILIVDPDFQRAAAIERSLAGKTLDVTIATNESDGLAICRNGLADAVLVAGELPGFNGFALCAQIKNDPACRHVPIAIIGEETPSCGRIRALDVGADDYLVIPTHEGLAGQRLGNFVQMAEIAGCVRAAEYGVASVGDGSVDLPQPHNILLIDPDSASRQRLTEILSPTCHVTSVDRKGRILADRSAAAFDVVLCDASVLKAAGGDFRARLGKRDAFGCRARMILLGVPPEAANVWGADDGLIRPIDRCAALMNVGLAARKRSLIKELRAAEIRLQLHAMLFRSPSAQVEEDPLRLAA